MSRIAGCGSLMIAGCAIAAAAVARADLVVTTIDYPGASITDPLAVSNNGRVAGTFVDAASGATKGFERFADGTLSSPIIDPNDNQNFTRAIGVNNAGTVVGDYLNLTGGVFTYHGFMLSGGNFTTFDHGGPFSTTLTGINDKGDLAGTFGSSVQANQGFVDINGKISDFAPSGATSTFTAAINNQDQVVGQYTDSSNDTHGFFRDSNGAMTSIDVPGATSTAAVGINDAGQITGTFADGSGTHGFFLKGGSFTTFDLTGVTFTAINGINNSDPWVGTYGLPNDPVTHGFIATNTPEPATMTLALLGGIGVCLTRRQQRRLAISVARKL